MNKRVKLLLMVVLSVILMMATVPSFADIQSANPDKSIEPEKKVVNLFDKDKNKLFDNLEEEMAKVNDDDSLPVVVLFNEKLDSSKKATVNTFLIDKEAKHEYMTFPGMAMDLTKKQIKELAKLDFVKQVEYDIPVQAMNNGARQWFGVDQAVSNYGVNGDRDGNLTSYSTSDIVVAVIDTGIDASHVDLDGGKVIGWKDYVNNRTTPYDDNGHGSHCAGTIAGTGEGNSAYKGVAPGAALVGVKVLDSAGSGSMSNVTAGIDWVVANKATYGIEVISLSLGTSTSSDGTDSTSVAVNNAYANGIVCCVAAGNSGPAKKTIGSPAAARDAITVGAFADVAEKGFNLMYFSSRGTTADGRIKPDVCAPGSNIMSVKYNSTNQYQSMSGTSMATPFTAGVCALMLDANPSITPAQVKSTITSTAQDWGPAGQDVDYGYGKLDAWAAIKSAGGYTTGSNIALPSHMYIADSIATAGKSDYFTFNVTSTTYPIAIGLIMTNWTSSTSPDFDIYLYNPSGTQVASATGSTRQDTIQFTPTVTGTYKIKVISYSGTGNYFFDLSTGGSSLVRTSNDI